MIYVACMHGRHACILRFLLAFHLCLTDGDACVMEAQRTAFLSQCGFAPRNDTGVGCAAFAPAWAAFEALYRGGSASLAPARSLIVTHAHTGEGFGFMAGRAVDFVRLGWVHVQHNEGWMQVEHDLTPSELEAMEDAMDAVGGICHEWRRESKVMRAVLASQSGVGAAEFLEAGELLGQLARCCQWLPGCAYSCGGSASARVTIPLATVVRAIKPQTHPARVNGGCCMCASDRGPTSAATGHEIPRRFGRDSACVELPRWQVRLADGLMIDDAASKINYVVTGD